MSSKLDHYGHITCILGKEMTKKEILNFIFENKLIAVLRTKEAEIALKAARTAIEGGIKIIEITYTIPQAGRVIRELATDKEILVGAGTILDSAQAEEAIGAGAKFIVSPIQNTDLVSLAKKNKIVSVLGGLTPIEIYQAMSSGADLVKIFPVNVLGGTNYIKQLIEPFPNLKMMVSGGVNLSNVRDYINLGVSSIAIGSALFPPEILKDNNYPWIVSIAGEFLKKL